MEVKTHAWQGVTIGSPEVSSWLRLDQIEDSRVVIQAWRQWRD